MVFLQAEAPLTWYFVREREGILYKKAEFLQEFGNFKRGEKYASVLISLTTSEIVAFDEQGNQKSQGFCLLPSERHKMFNCKYDTEDGECFDLKVEHEKELKFTVLNYCRYDADGKPIQKLAGSQAKALTPKFNEMVNRNNKLREHFERLCKQAEGVESC